MKSAHGFNQKALSTFSSITTTEIFSIAEYQVTDGEKMAAFTHAHEDYEFIIPFETIPLLRYQDVVYIGEVGYCYQVNSIIIFHKIFEVMAKLS